MNALLSGELFLFFGEKQPPFVPGLRILEMFNPWQKARDIFFTLLREHISPYKLALAVSLGIFWGVSPFWGLHTVLALATAFILRLNKPAILLGTLVANPLFAPFLIFISLESGCWLLYGSFSPLSFESAKSLFRDPSWSMIYNDLFLPYFWGSLLVSFLLAFISFWIVLWLSSRYQKRMALAENDNPVKPEHRDYL